MFDPAKHADLKHSPRLSAIKEVFKAIATNKPAQDVRRLAANLTVNLNAIERELLPSIITKELNNRDSKS
jgi:hypothetical protein